LFGGLLLVTALLVSLGVELVYLGDHLNGSTMFRMNTVFKFYIQVWLLFASGGAVAIYYIIYGLRDRASRKSDEDASEKSNDVSEPWDIGASTNPLGSAQLSSFEPSDVLAEGVAPLPSNGAVHGEPAVERPANNWLVWSADEIEDSYDLPQVVERPVAGMDESQVASLVGLLPEGANNGDGADVAGRGQMEPNTHHVEGEAKSPLWVPARVVWTAVMAVFVVVSLTYTFYGTQDRVRQRFPNSPAFGTLSGTRYMQTAQYSTSVQGPNGDVPITVNLKYDYEAIDWMNRNIEGLATIAELPAEYYRADGMRAATNTGLPMVIGGLHQDEQRAGVYARLVGNRQGDMNEFFTTNDVQRALTVISKYNIQYIYLGQLEQARAGEAGIAKFAQMADPKIGILQEVFKTQDNPPGVPGTIIYKVSTAADKDPRILVGAPVANSGLPGISITPIPTSTPIPPPTPPVDNPELKQLIAAVAANPGDRDARIRLAEWYRDNGYPQEGAKELEIVVKQDPANVALSSQLGDLYTAAGMPEQALKAWENGRDSAPDNPDAHNKVGIAYFERKRYDDAAREFQAAVAANSAYVESWYHLGEVYERKGEVENARRAYQSTIDNSREANSWKDSAQKRLSELK
jgi:tetratricopeptide (TPR) repeat protein